ncbi:hypothetical protein [Staphylococcus shinii]|uniref:hypothetical protein n=1 Tax=Staphylococcus shinii TaxID=2912228 RepID=UPI003CF69AA8
MQMLSIKTLKSVHGGKSIGDKIEGAIGKGTSAIWNGAGRIATEMGNNATMKSNIYRGEDPTKKL